MKLLRSFACVCSFALCTAFVQAATFGDFEYQEFASEITVTRYTGSATSLDIPASINGKPVTAIGEGAFYYCQGLILLTIPDSVTAIGNHAFSNCSSLQSITIDDSVIAIGTGAFSSCLSLIRIVFEGGPPEYIIPEEWDGLKWEYPEKEGEAWHEVIASGRFEGRSITFEAYKSAQIPESEKVWRYSVNADGTVKLLGVIPREMLSGAVPLPVELEGRKVTVIGDYAFCDCGLTSVEIPDGVTIIGKDAFSFCEGLTSITIPDSVTIIEFGAFGECDGLKAVTIPGSVTTIGWYAFSSCSSLQSVTITDGVAIIGIDAFSGCGNLMSITIPDSVTAIESFAFSGCLALVEIVFKGKPPMYKTPSEWNRLTWKYPAAEREAWQKAIESGQFEGMGITFEEYDTPDIVFDETVPELDRDWLREALEARGLSGTVTVAGDAGTLEVFRMLGVLPQIKQDGSTLTVDMGTEAAFATLRESVVAGEIISKNQIAAKLDEQVREMALTAPMIEVGPDGITVEIGFQTAKTLGEWKPMLLTDRAATVETSKEGTLRVHIAKPEGSNAAFYKFVVPDGLQNATDIERR